jgi:hypothetical protein
LVGVVHRGFGWSTLALRHKYLAMQWQYDELSSTCRVFVPRASRGQGAAFSFSLYFDRVRVLNTRVNWTFVFWKSKHHFYISWGRGNLLRGWLHLTSVLGFWEFRAKILRTFATFDYFCRHSYEETNSVKKCFYY